MSRRAFCLTLAGLAGGCRPSIGPTVTTARMSLTPLESAVFFLVHQQSRDGSWRSDTYANFRDGTALTPLVLNALLALPAPQQPAAAISKGTDFLMTLVKNGQVDAGKYGLPYPAYNAANTLHAFCRLKGHEAARAVWVRFLRERQLTEELGWQPADPEYGGWGYCPTLPRKPKPGVFGPPFVESNLSATLYVLDALRAAGLPAGDPAIQKALTLVERLQNYREQEADPALDDGGFFFIHNDPVRNKAGLSAPGRYASYGSTTADGVRAMLLCGLKPDHPRVAAGRRWLVKHFRADSHPGPYEKSRELNREAIYFYYCASVAQAFTDLEVKEIPWAPALAKGLAGRQRPDGSWSNPAHAFREDDTLTATSFAVLALAHCA